VELRRLGRTGHLSSVAILGGAACWEASLEEAGAWLGLARSRGVNHLDIAPQYGAAEAVVGPHLAASRSEMFIAGKTLRANPDGVLDQFDNTRRQLNCDVLDLYQAHAVTSLDELDRRSRAIEQIIRLREQGRTRFAGITGHDMTVPRAFLEALRRFDLDTVMFPIYPALWGNAAYREAAEELLALCGERDLCVMVIKALAHRPWADRSSESGVGQSAGTRWATSWYEPAAADEDN
jgi:aryl-alcohol dehydrogenase-like predicted oxidoreductase